MMLRVLSFAGLLAALSLVPAHAAPGVGLRTERSAEASDAPERSTKAVDDAYRAARERDEARQRQWDAEMKALASSICIGC